MDNCVLLLVGDIRSVTVIHTDLTVTYFTEILELKGQEMCFLLV